MPVLSKVEGGSKASEARSLSEALTKQAHAVCRHYLSAGRREGRYWLVGDIHNNPGRSLSVRLSAAPGARGAPGKWIDAATGDHGDLLDLIGLVAGKRTLAKTMEEARDFLALPAPPPETGNDHPRPKATPSVRAKRLFKITKPLIGSIGQTYLQGRAIAYAREFPALRFMPDCYYSPGDDRPLETWPALVAAVTDNQGTLTGVHRTWLARDGTDKAPIETPRKALGAVLGNAIRFGTADTVLIAGEGLETMLSLLDAMPMMSMAACTSANHLALFEPPPSLKRLYIARDDDASEMLLEELQLYGHRPFDDEPDPRPLPEPGPMQGAITDIFDALVVTMGDTRLEPDLEDLLWAQVNLFHRHLARIERELDDNEDGQKRSQREQDGSEIRSVELETLLAQGLTLIERRNALEYMRDTAADLFEVHTRSSWRPHSGSMVSHRTLTASLIDSRDFLAAKRRADIAPLTPAGTRIAFTGGLDYVDHLAIWAVLDKVHAKHPDMVLLHGGSPKGAERIASCWAKNRQIAQIQFKPDWTAHAKAAPFKRNDLLLAQFPIGVVIFPGSGISDNLADKARKMGIPLMDYR